MEPVFLPSCPLAFKFDLEAQSFDQEENPEECVVDFTNHVSEPVACVADYVKH